jgi:hypothetical protein
MADDDPAPTSPPRCHCGGMLVLGWGTCEQCGQVGRMLECITSGSLHWRPPDDHVHRQRSE